MGYAHSFVIRHSSFSRDGVVSVSAPRMAAQDAFGGEVSAFECAVFAYGFHAVARASGLVSAGRGENGRDAELINAYQQHKDQAQSVGKGAIQVQKRQGEQMKELHTAYGLRMGDCAAQRNKKRTAIRQGQGEKVAAASGAGGSAFCPLYRQG